MDITLFWEVVKQNAAHISTLNGEMGAVQAHLESINVLIKWMLGCMSATFFVVLAAFATTLKNLSLTKKNGNK